VFNVRQSSAAAPQIENDGSSTAADTAVAVAVMNPMTDAVSGQLSFAGIRTRSRASLSVYAIELLAGLTM
jgi:hypothetical protein